MGGEGVDSGWEGGIADVSCVVREGNHYIA